MGLRTAYWSASGRAGLLGNPSDIYGGKVLASATAERNACRLVVGEDDRPPEDLRLWEAAITRIPPPPGPVRVEWTTGVPRSSGMSGSTALLAATLACLVELQGGDPLEDPPLFAELVRDVERRNASIVCGYQDAHMIVSGGLRLMDFSGKTPRLDGGPLPSFRPVASRLEFLVVTTGVTRVSGSVHSPMVERWLMGEPAVVEAMRELAGIAEVGAGHLERGEANEFGDLMNRNQAIARALGGSGEDVDRLVAACLAGGARGAKLCGAGLGGTVVALTDDPIALEAHLRREGYERFPRLDPGGGGLRREGG